MINQAVAKRLKVTAGGKVMARKAGKQHLNQHKSSGKLRALSKDFILYPRIVER